MASDIPKDFGAWNSLFVDSYELPNRFILTSGVDHESKVAVDFIRDLPTSR